MIARILILLSGVLILASCQSDSNRRNTADAQIEKRIDELISRMTVEEKIGQTNQLTVYGTTEELCEKIRNGEIGSLLNVVDPADINTLQRAAVEQSRLGIPLLIARDVIHGFRTVFPIPLGQAATFDPALVEQGARIAAIEASAARAHPPPPPPPGPSLRCSTSRATRAGAASPNRQARIPV